MSSPNDTATTSLLSLPNELLLALGEYLPPKSLYSLIRTSRRLAVLLLPRLRTLACSGEFSITALFWAAVSRNKPLATLILFKTTTVFKVAGAPHPAWIPIQGVPGKHGDSVTDFVISQGVDLMLFYQYDVFKPLFWAVAAAHKNLVALLLSHGASCDSFNSDGRSPLHEAIYRGDHEIVQLLATESSINLRDEEGLEPLYWAVVFREDATLVRILLEKGADIASYRETTSGRGLLHLAVRRPRTHAMAQALLDHGADPTQRSHAHQTPLHVAARSADAATVAALLQHPGCAANINARDMAGWSPLHHAARAGLVDVIRLLLDRGAEVNVRDSYGSTPLHRAVWHGKNEVVSVLIGKGADMNTPDDSGKTGMDLAMIRLKVREERESR